MAPLCGFEGEEHVRIFLWAVPRSCSTAFTKFMTFVEDVSEVWFEPYVVSCYNSDDKLRQLAYRRAAGVSDRFPEGNNRENLRTLASYSYANTKRELERPRKGKKGKYIFIKDMSFAIHGHYDALPDEEKIPVRHIFLIRHPHRFLPSWFLHAKRFMGVSPDASIDITKDLLAGAKEDQLLKLWRFIKKKNNGRNPVVIDTDRLLQDPERILPKLFVEMDIPWKDSYLRWSEEEDFLLTWNIAIDHIGVKPGDRGFTRAFTSKSFVKVGKPLPRKEELPPESQETVDIYMPGYEEMLQHALY